ncbi:hyaluronidase PH-20-like isoform X2 [Talpa occidentalis]|uniref:hyaluronidase PH-20-like isoform X2 n=1 Tax=Talpa occidentalis TaxID=50954 RepID=UPI0018906C45|nr:hyaluronidase PH-20-like isoform X2 [Talpa occidentalis]
MAAVMFKNIFFRIFVGFHGTFLLHPVCLTQELRASPFLPNTAYLWGSNAPIEFCDELHDIHIDMSLFALSGSPRKQITEQGIALFYIHKLGYYPFVELHTGENVNGGLPQLGCLKKHLDKANNDIRYYIASNTPGLAVIDWPEWRPIWGRNTGLKEVYMERSIELELKKNPSFAYWQAIRAAENEFQEAGRGFMAETLKLGRSLRPKSLWGFYFFPECYNKDYQKPEFTGTCADIEKERNNDLLWLWKESTALYPSVYLNTRITAKNQAIFVRNRVQEAFRISQIQDPKNPLPVIAYFRPVFTDKPEIFLSKNDLVHTIGESMALGVSGLVMWGGYEIIRSLEDCRSIDSFVSETLNPYIINVTLAAKMCNQVLCQDKGVCIRKNWNSSDYLHLNSETFAIQAMKGGNYAMHGHPTIKDLRHFTQNFRCSCYAGVNCKTTVDVKTTDNIYVQ